MPFYKLRSPNLPMFRNEYDRPQFDQFANALRLYFNQLDGTFTELANPLGAALLNRPTALYYSTTDQTAGNIDEAYPIEFENTYFENGMTINGNTDSEITVDKSGIYNFQFSGQLLSSSGSTKTAQIWIRRNGTDIGYSAHIYEDSKNGGITEANWNFNIDLQAGDYIEMVWAVSNTALSLDSTAPSAPYPGIPSAVMAVNFVSNLEGFTIATAP
jgi:hypothetical protein